MGIPLFLDFDGVLHPDGCHESRHFCRLPLLVKALRELPQLEIVVASTWRASKDGEAALRQALGVELSERVQGSTPQFRELDDVPPALYAYEREAECDAWLRAHGRLSAPWFALDDRAWLFRPFNKRLVLVPRATGMTEEVVHTLVDMVRRV